MKKLITVVTLLSALAMLLCAPVSAAGYPSESDAAALISKAEELRGMFYEDEGRNFIGEIVSNADTEAIIKRSGYEGAKFAALSEKYSTPEKLTDYCRSIFTNAVAENTVKEGKYVFIENGTLYFAFYSPQCPSYSFITNAADSIKSYDGKDGVLTVTIQLRHYLSAMGEKYEDVDFTFEIVQTQDCARISGGSFVDKFFSKANPDTGDTPIYAFTAAALFSAVGAGFVFKKRRHAA